MNLPEPWQLVRLSAICTINPPLPPAERPSPDTLVTFVPMAAVDEIDGRVTNPTTRIFQEVSKGFTPFRENDVLFAKITPSMENGKAAIATNLKNGLGFGSTEFHVLRPTEYLLPDYLFYFIRQPSFRARARTAFVGSAGQQRVPSRFLERVQIPLPTLPEQQRIAAILRGADSLREQRRQAIAQLDELLQSAFIEMFCTSQSENWPQETIEDLAVDKPNAIHTGPFGSQLLHSEFVNEGIAVLGIDNVVQNFFTWAERRFITKEKYEGLKRYRVFPGDVLITIMGTCGRCAVVPNDIPLSISTKHLCCITLDQKRCLPAYLQACFLNHPKVLRRLGVSKRGAVMPGLNMQIIKELSIPLPPFPLQQKFAEIALCFNQLRLQQQEAKCKAETLFQSLQQYAFSGNLTSVWRDSRYRELEAATRVRDAALGQIGGKVTIPERTPTERPWLPQPERDWLMDQLSELQSFVWRALQKWSGILVPSEDLDEFFLQCFSNGHPENASDHVLRALDQLAGLGLIAKITVPNQQGEYVTSYRGLREDELSQPADSQSLSELRR